MNLALYFKRILKIIIISLFIYDKNKYYKEMIHSNKIDSLAQLFNQTVLESLSKSIKKNSMEKARNININNNYQAHQLFSIPGAKYITEKTKRFVLKNFASHFNNTNSNMTDVKTKCKKNKFSSAFVAPTPETKLNFYFLTIYDTIITIIALSLFITDSYIPIILLLTDTFLKVFNFSLISYSHFNLGKLYQYFYTLIKDIAKMDIKLMFTQFYSLMRPLFFNMLFFHLLLSLLITLYIEHKLRSINFKSNTDETEKRIETTKEMETSKHDTKYPIEENSKRKTTKSTHDSHYHHETMATSPIREVRRVDSAKKNSSRDGTPSRRRRIVEEANF